MADNNKTKADELILEAFKKKDKKALEAYKNLKTELQKALTAKNAPEYSEAVFVQVAAKYCKSLTDAIQQFKDGGRKDLAKEYEAELNILSPLVPPQATPSDIMIALYDWAGKHDFLEWVDPNNHNLFQTPRIPKKEMGNAMKALKSQFPTTDGKYLSGQLNQFIIK